MPNENPAQPGLPFKPSEEDQPPTFPPEILTEILSAMADILMAAKQEKDVDHD